MGVLTVLARIQGYEVFLGLGLPLEYPSHLEPAELMLCFPSCCHDKTAMSICYVPGITLTFLAPLASETTQGGISLFQ